MSVNRDSFWSFFPLFLINLGKQLKHCRDTVNKTDSFIG